ncbi:MAG: S26 family signal peptidase, partial [Anaerolineales bacterium]|nr:S26 family signal peptidase [Anaerolineales bacterium]
MADVNPSLVAELLQESLQRGQTPFVTITSNSMAPLLRRGDQIGLEALPAGQLRPGDIILLRAPGELVCHRYWGNPAGNP